MVVCGGNGVDVWSGHVSSTAVGVHDFVYVTYCELCGMGFEGAEAIAEVSGGAVEGRAGEITHRGDGGAECPADLAFKDVELGIAEEAELEGEVLANEEAEEDAYSAGLY
jgi:hypothetical protein